MPIKETGGGGYNRLAAILTSRDDRIIRQAERLADAKQRSAALSKKYQELIIDATPETEAEQKEHEKLVRTIRKDLRTLNAEIEDLEERLYVMQKGRDAKTSSVVEAAERTLFETQKELESINKAWKKSVNRIKSLWEQYLAEVVKIRELEDEASAAYSKRGFAYENLPKSAALIYIGSIEEPTSLRQKRGPVFHAVTHQHQITESYNRKQIFTY